MQVQAASRTERSAGQDTDSQRSVENTTGREDTGQLSPASPTPTPQELSSSEIVSMMESRHKVTGTARLIAQPDGTMVVEFDGFSITYWRDDLYVYAVPGADRTSPDGHRVGYVDSGRLTDRRYVLPSDLDTSEPKTLMVYCKGAAMPITTATLNT